MAHTAATVPSEDMVSMDPTPTLVMAASADSVVTPLAYQVPPVAAEASFPNFLQVEAHPVLLAQAPGPAPAPAAAVHGHNRNFGLCLN